MTRLSILLTLSLFLSFCSKKEKREFSGNVYLSSKSTAVAGATVRFAMLKAIYAEDSNNTDWYTIGNTDSKGRFSTVMEVSKDDQINELSIEYKGNWYTMPLLAKKSNKDLEIILE